MAAAENVLSRRARKRRFPPSSTTAMAPPALFFFASASAAAATALAPARLSTLLSTVCAGEAVLPAAPAITTPRTKLASLLKNHLVLIVRLKARRPRPRPEVLRLAGRSGRDNDDRPVTRR